MDRFFPVAVYAAMLGGTVGGQFLGMAFDAAIGRRLLWLPLVFSVLLEAILGARFGASRVGHALTSRERMRLSLHYSLALAGVSVPLVGWLAASHASRAQLATGGGITPSTLLFWGTCVLGLLVAYTVVRTTLMGVFTRRHA